MGLNVTLPPGLNRSDLVIEPISSISMNVPLSTSIPQAGMNGAIEFDGIDSYVTLPSFRIITGFTVEGWMLPFHEHSTQTIVSKQSALGDIVFQLSLAANPSHCLGAMTCLAVQLGRTSMPVAVPSSTMPVTAPARTLRPSITDIAL